MYDMTYPCLLSFKLLVVFVAALRIFAVLMFVFLSSGGMAGTRCALILMKEKFSEARLHSNSLITKQNN
jgi:hypothetical protein